MAEMTPITPDMQPVSPAPGEGTPFVAERFRNDTAPEAASSANWVPAGIVALIALILFAVALVIILQDGSFLSNA